MTTVEALNSWGATWAAFMTRAVVDVSCLLVLTLAVWLPVRRRLSAQVGYGLFCLVLLKLFVPVPASWPSAADRARFVPFFATPAFDTPRVEAARWTLPDAGDESPTAATLGDAPALPARVRPPGEPGVATVPTRVPLSYATLLMLAWLVGAAVLFARFVARLRATRRLIRLAAPLEPGWLPVDVDELKRSAGVGGQVRWVVSPRVSSPAVGGLWRPTVVLPPDVDDGLTPRQLAWVLLHELAHVRRRDLWVVVGQAVAQALFFFHPAVHVANWLIDQLREYACDDAALAVCQTPRRDCGEGFLTIVARGVEREFGVPAALGLFASRTLITRRLVRILDKQRRVHGRLSPAGALGLFAVGLLVLPFGPPRLVWGTPSGSPTTRQTLVFEPLAGEPSTFAAGAVWRREAGGRVAALAYAPDGAVLAVAGERGVVELREVATGRVTRRLVGHTDTVSCLAFSPDGRTLATGSFDRTVRLWDVRSGQSRSTLSGHANWVFALAFSPDGTRLASAGHDRLVRIWDPESGDPVREPFADGGSVRAVAYSPDGQTLASGGAAGVIVLRSVATGELVRRLARHEGTVRALAYSNDGTTLASAGEDGVARLWDVKSGRERAVLTGHSEMVAGLVFSVNGGLLATAGVEGAVTLWDVRDGRARSTWTAHSGGVSALASPPAGAGFATGGYDGSVRLWVPAAPVFTPAFTWPSAGEPASVAFGPGGRSLFVAGERGVACWSVPEGAARLIRDEGSTVARSERSGIYVTGDSSGRLALHGADDGRPTASWHGHAGTVSSLAFAPDGRWFASAGADGTVRLWGVAGSRLLATLPTGNGPASELRIAPDGEMVAFSAGGTVQLWDVRTRRRRAALSDSVRLAIAPGGASLATASADGTITVRDATTLAAGLTFANGPCGSLAYSTDGRLLASAHESGEVLLWDVRSGRQLARLKGHDGPAVAVAFGGDGRFVATAGHDRTVRLWNLQSRRQMPRATLGDGDGSIWAVSYAPDGKTLAVAEGAIDEPGAVTVWDLDERQVKGVLDGHARGVAAAAFSPDGETLASGSWDGTIRVWDPARRALRYELKGLNGVTSLAFSPDSRQLAVAGEGKLLTLWDVRTGAEAGRLTDFRSDVQCAAFSPDGALLATGGGAFGTGSRPGGGEVRVWDARTGSLVTELNGHERAVVSLAFAPDGRSLATGAMDQSLRVWELPSGRPRVALCGLGGGVHAVAYSPDGRLVVWGGRGDGLVSVLDARDGAEVARLIGQGSAARAVAFSPDGRTVAVSGADRTIRLWDAPVLPDPTVPSSSWRFDRDSGKSRTFSVEGPR